jgi:hypothetical protein
MPARPGLLNGGPAQFHTASSIAKTYDYRDESGSVLFQVVRFEPKAFKQRRPDGQGGWDWKLRDTRRVPYRLPELVKAVAAGRTIYIPEGEKDVESLQAIGFAATTNPGGVKKWREAYSEFLRGADVVVLPDNHPEGREHGEQVVASLRGIASRVRVLDIGKVWPQCPHKGDISDWLAGRGSAEQLKQIIDSLPELVASAHNRPSPRQDSQDSHFAEADWPIMHEAAYYGLAGEVVRTIEPHSEADPVAILLQFLAAFGNAVGIHPFVQREGDRHRAKLFIVVSGTTSKGRKGTALGRMAIASPDWGTR